ncbi:RNA binding motif protein 12Ba [Silurus meridionalis]|nr:RNA binding motif protein 12Ba [Silurus meridionalis]KAI5092299.1 hypothetical protein C0J45_17930 [Silurus meridionalis]
MEVVLRLQGLNIEAGPEDIRRFFHGLPIPEGGVHITGGKLGEAFIIFNTERAGQLAMLCSGKRLKGSQVTLHKSSMAEFKHEMELRLRKRKCTPRESEPLPQTTNPTELCTTLLLGIVAAVQGLQSNIQMNTVQASVSPPRLTNVPKPDKNNMERKILVEDHVRPPNNDLKMTEQTRHHVEEQQEREKEVDVCKPGYLRLYGLPNSITKEEVCMFLDGLNVVDVVTNTLPGEDQCCLVKMATFKEAEEGLKYSYNSQSGHIEVRLAHERMWENATEHRKRTRCSTSSEKDNFSQDVCLHRNFPPKRPKWQHSNSPPFNTEYCVMVKNLPNTITKTEIRNLFSCPHIPNNNIQHLLNKHRERTSTVFIIYTQPEEYTKAMNMDGSVFDSRTIDVSSVTKEKMWALMHQSRRTDSERSRSCIYARNFPASAGKTEVKEFFGACNISEDDIEMLVDENGNGIGEAVVRFGCDDRAREARRLQRKIFRQEPILLSYISPQQRKELLHRTRHF